MNKISYVCGFLIVLFSLIFSEKIVAQEGSGYNPNSVYPVHKSYKMYSKTIWRRIDLEEKQNLPFFSRNRELPTVIMNAVKSGLLFPYTNDSLNTRMSKETFLENLKMPEEEGGLTEEEIEMGFGGDDFGFDDGGFGEEGEGTEEASLGAEEFSSRDFSIAEIKEDMFFDRMRSRMYYDIIAITLYLPAENNPALFEKPLASFRYKDLVELFRKIPDEAVWYNAQNNAEDKNFADAFQLRLFSSMLTKYSNPADRRVVEIYNKSRKDGIVASQKIDHDIVEFENELWEY